MKTEHFTLNHKQIIEWKDGKIKNINCLCKYGSIHRDQWESGKPLCSHIKELLKNIAKTKMITYKRLTPMRKHWLKAFVGFKCEEDKKKHPEKELEIHKINPELGYSLRNVKVLCKKCHDVYSSADRKARGTQ